jgi:hypothetical protein
MKRPVVVFSPIWGRVFMFLKSDWLDFFRWLIRSSVSREEFYEKIDGWIRFGLEKGCCDGGFAFNGRDSDPPIQRCRAIDATVQ